MGSVDGGAVAHDGPRASLRQKIGEQSPIVRRSRSSLPLQCGDCGSICYYWAKR